jgi:hypothetical protein
MFSPAYFTTVDSMHLSVVAVINVGSGEPNSEDMHLIRCSDMIISLTMGIAA